MSQEVTCPAQIPKELSPKLSPCPNFSRAHRVHIKDPLVVLVEVATHLKSLKTNHYLGQ